MPGVLVGVMVGAAVAVGVNGVAVGEMVGDGTGVRLGGIVAAGAARTAGWVMVPQALNTSPSIMIREMGDSLDLLLLFGAQ